MDGRGGAYLLGDNGDFGGVADRRRMVHRGRGMAVTTERSRRRGDRMEKSIWQNMLQGTAMIDK